MLNFVTEVAGSPGAVLIRAAEPLQNESLMYQRRKLNPLQARARLLVTSGPGKLCQAMGICLSHNEQSLTGPIFEVHDDGYRPVSISQSGRVGIRVATETPWRFFITNHSNVSRAPQNKTAVLIE